MSDTNQSVLAPLLSWASLFGGPVNNGTVMIK